MAVTSLYRKQGERFTDNSGNALAAGKIYYYRAGTTTLQDTYSNQTGTVANTNPVVLDGAGRIDTPVYIGTANDYKELLTDSSGNTISPWPFDNIPKAVDPTAGQTGFSLFLIPWLQYTSSASPVTVSTANVGYGFEADTSGGSVTFNLPSAASTGAGKGFWFKKTAAGNNLIVTPNGTDTIDGGGTFTMTAQNQSIGINSDGANWQIITNVSIAVSQPPKGRLTLTTGVPVLAADVSGASTVYYTAYDGGNSIPVWNGSSFTVLTYAADLSLTLTSAASSNSIVDVFCINQSGPVLAFGPTWTSATAGSSARGTGAGTTELQLKNGIWTNKNAITLTNGATVYSGIAANQATYLGSISIDSSAGQTTCHKTFGQSRKFGVWNAYNRKPLVLLAGDTTATWSYSTATYRPSNNATANSISVFCGLAEETIVNDFTQLAIPGGGAWSVGIGWNSTTAVSGQIGGDSVGGNGSTNFQRNARYVAAPTLGLNTVTSLEKAAAATTFDGTNANMQLVCSYMG